MQIMLIQTMIFSSNKVMSQVLLDEEQKEMSAEHPHLQLLLEDNPFHSDNVVLEGNRMEQGRKGKIKNKDIIDKMKKLDEGNEIAKKLKKELNKIKINENVKIPKEKSEQSKLFFDMSFLKNFKIPKLGGDIFNPVLDSLNFEMHMPGYKYCGPGTDLDNRLWRGDRGINPLDQACKRHDISCDVYRQDPWERRQADLILLEIAKNRMFSTDASPCEKSAALVIINSMKAKFNPKPRNIPFNKLVPQIENIMRKMKPICV